MRWLLCCAQQLLFPPRTSLLLPSVVTPFHSSSFLVPSLHFLHLQFDKRDCSGACGIPSYDPGPLVPCNPVSNQGKTNPVSTDPNEETNHIRLNTLHERTPIWVKNFRVQ
ncbi:hypothetical protein L207DRAFT_16462 [Hyaloscypha variabilis F]|uniref:Secreted protein n=1 Tax=Hyaloscypha variabilis (strain UAMH 11265 / GT02V1 / F) TaxID=1149755 RepID=A0A2J6SDC2_HYAVF|nr:hypothetical protein L207DRAFT_16462 [Hyaloscypha variabilis F]